MLRKKIKVYLSHFIRGPEGSEATPDVIKANCDKAKEWGKALWLYFGNNLKLYVPAEHDEALLIAMKKNYLTVDQVLDIDCTIVRTCDVLLIAKWGAGFSEGMCREIDTAKRLGIPTRVFTDVKEEDLRALQIWLERLCQ